jgi:hypothetical protein
MTHPFRNESIWDGLLSSPKLYRGLGQLLEVRKTRPKKINPYAAAEGTPVAKIRDVNATPESKIEQVTVAAIPQIMRTTLRSWPFGDAWETQLENGRTSSRATGKTSLKGCDHGYCSVLLAARYL